MSGPIKEKKNSKEQILNLVRQASAGIQKHDLKADTVRETSVLCDGLQLSSRYDRQALASYQLKNIDFKKDIWIYGPGLGDSARMACGLISSGHTVHVVVICPMLFCQLCETDTFDGLFTNPKISFELGDDSYPIHQNSCCCFTELMLEMNYANTLKTSLRCALDEDYAKKNFKNSIGARMLKRARANLSALRSERPLTQDVLPQCQSAAVLCSGPSLESDFSKLKSWLSAHPGAKVIAVETALIYLEKTDLIPDFIVNIDDLAALRAGDMYMKDPSYYKKSALIYAVSSPEKLWGSFEGPRYYLTTQNMSAAIPELPVSMRLYSSGSVALTAVSLSLALGATEIALLGADFAYDNGYSHAGLKIGNDPLTGTVGRIRVMCNDGQLRDTQRNFLVYREDLASLIASRPDVKFQNLASHGAVIRGALAI